MTNIKEGEIVSVKKGKRPKRTKKVKAEIMEAEIVEPRILGVKDRARVRKQIKKAVWRKDRGIRNNIDFVCYYIDMVLDQSLDFHFFRLPLVILILMVGVLILFPNSRLLFIFGAIIINWRLYHGYRKTRQGLPV